MTMNPLTLLVVLAAFFACAGLGFYALSRLEARRRPQPAPPPVISPKTEEETADFPPPITRLKADKEAALAFPLPGLIDRIAEQEAVPLAKAQRFEREFRRWSVLAAASRRAISLNSPIVNRVRLLLEADANLYGQFSQAVAGRPIPLPADAGGEMMKARFFVTYEAVWGEAPPMDIWGSPNAAELDAVRATLVQSRSSSTASTNTSAYDDGGLATWVLLNLYWINSQADAPGHSGSETSGAESSSSYSDSSSSSSSSDSASSSSSSSDSGSSSSSDSSGF